MTISRSRTLDGAGMHIFLSWSGTLSKNIANEFKDLLEQILPGNDVYVSNQEIRSGERWVANIGKGLEDASYGLLFVNPSNKDAPWILFEAGALAKSFSSSNVVPVLTNMSDADLSTSPLSQFQNRKLTKEDISTLILDINATSERPIAGERVLRSFEAFWPDSWSRIGKFIQDSERQASSPKTDTASQIRNLQDAVSEVLKILRTSNAPVASMSAPRLMTGGPRSPNRIMLEKFDGKFYILMNKDLPYLKVKLTATRQPIGQIGRVESMSDLISAAELVVEEYLESQQGD